MKRKYESPETDIVEIEQHLLSGTSGSGFTEGETGNVGVGKGEYDPEDAW